MRLGKSLSAGSAISGCRKRGHHTCGLLKNQIECRSPLPHICRAMIDLLIPLLHHPAVFPYTHKAMIPVTANSVSRYPAQAGDATFLFELYRSTRAEELAAW